MDPVSVTMPAEMIEEIDQRRPSTTPRSEWVRKAAIARLFDESHGRWDDIPDIDEDEFDELWQDISEGTNDARALA